MKAGTRVQQVGVAVIRKPRNQRARVRQNTGRAPREREDANEDGAIYGALRSRSCALKQLGILKLLSHLLQC
jgi:hypothetical protein